MEDPREEEQMSDAPEQGSPEDEPAGGAPEQVEEEVAEAAAGEEALPEDGTSPLDEPSDGEPSDGEPSDGEASDGDAEDGDAEDEDAGDGGSEDETEEGGAADADAEGGETQDDGTPEEARVDEPEMSSPEPELPEEVPGQAIEALAEETSVEQDVPEQPVEPAPETYEPDPVEQAPAAEAADEVPEPAAAPAIEEVEEPGGPFDGPGDWYVIHTYAGYENKVKTNLGSRIQTMQMQDKIFDVVIPMEDVMEIKGGRKQVVQKKVFPGYLLVKMEYDDDSWYVVRNTPGVTGFVSSGTGQKPTPLSRREVEKILSVKKEETKPQFRLEFEEGDVVRIIAGPFADFNGTISEINVDQSKVKVMVNIFDRETPVELSFDQVARV
jgi:transcription termination/antitermination protein NusG